MLSYSSLSYKYRHWLYHHRSTDQFYTLQLKCTQDKMETATELHHHVQHHHGICICTRTTERDGNRKGWEKCSYNNNKNNENQHRSQVYILVQVSLAAHLKYVLIIMREVVFLSCVKHSATKQCFYHALVGQSVILDSSILTQTRCGNQFSQAR